VELRWKVGGALGLAHIGVQEWVESIASSTVASARREPGQGPKPFEPLQRYSTTKGPYLGGEGAFGRERRREVTTAGMLGQMSARLSIPALRAALKDTEPRVVLAATHALYTLSDSTASGVYIAIRSRRQPSWQFRAAPATATGLGMTRLSSIP
jgi:hypothetical protein